MKWSWPWVGRGRLEDALARLAAADAERREMQAILLARPVSQQSAPSSAWSMSQPGPVVVELPDLSERSEADENQGVAQAYTTPFDRTIRRFEEAHKNGVIPEKYRARA